MWFLLFFLIASTIFAEADLKIVSAETRPGSENILLYVKITNNGPEPAYHVGIRINEKNFSLKAVAVGEVREETIKMEIGSGEFLIQLFDSVEPDTYPADNVVRTSLPPPPKTADLEIVHATVENTQPVADPVLLLNLRLRNRGPENVPTSKITLEMSSFQTVIIQTERKLEPFRAGEEKEIKIKIPIGKLLIFGNEARLSLKWISEIVDPWEKNNVYVLTLLLIPRLPDLVVEEVKVDARGNLLFMITNKGNVSAPATQTVLYVNGALVRRYNTPALSSGSQRRHQYGGTKIIPGTKIAVVADFGAEVNEVSEENNRFEFTTK